jgi:hypothetical protein
MHILTKIRLLESGLHEVDPSATVDFGYDKLRYQWTALGIYSTDKKGVRVNENMIVSSQLSEYEQEQLESALVTRLQWIKNDYSEKAKTAGKILKAVNDKDMDY